MQWVMHHFNGIGGFLHWDCGCTPSPTATGVPSGYQYLQLCLSF